MDEDAARGDRLSRISTRWEDLRRAQSDGDATAWAAVLDRYHLAARRYLRGAVGDPDAADELYQEFALKLLRGDFHRADPSLGRFRDFMRTALIRLVHAHRRSSRRAAHLPLTADVAAEETGEAARFDAIWREALLDRTWRRLEALEARGGPLFYTVLHRRTEAPGLSSARLAEQIGRELGRSISTPNLRQVLHRARAEFARLLLEEVAASLPAGSPFEAIECELIDTGLLAFCREAVSRARPAPGRDR